MSPLHVLNCPRTTPA